MGRVLEFALAKMVISIVSVASAIIVAKIVGARITELFGRMIEVFP